MAKRSWLEAMMRSVARGRFKCVVCRDTGVRRSPRGNVVRCAFCVTSALWKAPQVLGLANGHVVIPKRTAWRRSQAAKNGHTRSG